jgi:hypothetical protein
MIGARPVGNPTKDAGAVFEIDVAAGVEGYC